MYLCKYVYYSDDVACTKAWFVLVVLRFRDG